MEGGDFWFGRAITQLRGVHCTTFVVDSVVTLEHGPFSDEAKVKLA
ncbi:MAG: hypothetical protein NVS1B6_14300 [Steroidobacteraceae bacterium]